MREILTMELDPNFQKRSVALIPARQGSKGIPDKCIRKVGKIPLLVRAVQVAKNATSVQDAYVSTDSPRYARLAEEAGAIIPYLRPAHLATDTASSIDVALHFLDWYQETYHRLPDYFLYLQLTTPFVTPDDIDQAYNILVSPEVDAVCSVAPLEYKWEWLRLLTPEGYLSLLPGVIDPYRPRQAMVSLYRVNGGIYWIKPNVLYQCRSFTPSRTKPYVMPISRSLDIDTAEDLRKARILCKQQTKRGGPQE